MTVSEKIRFIIQHSRPAFWLGSGAFFLIGAWSVELTGAIFWLGLIFSTIPAGLIINGVNDIADKDSDANNPRKQAAGSVLSTQQTQFLTTAIICTAVVFFVLFFFLSATAVLTYCALIGIWAAYSLPPVRLKRIPFVDSLSNGAGMLFFTFLARSLVTSGWEVFAVSQVVWATLLGVIAVHALQTTWDLETDAAQGDTTMGTILQTRGVIVFATILFTLALVLLRSSFFAIQVYLVGVIGVCLVLLLFPKKHFLFYATWLLLYSFPALVLLLFVLYPNFSTALSK